MTAHVDHLQVSLSLAEFPLAPDVPRPFPPVAPEPSPLESLTDGERRVLAMVCGAFLAGDDPYLLAAELTHMAGSLDLNQEQFHHELAGLGFAGLLNVTRSQLDFEIEQVECTAAGMEAFCRGFLAGRYETLLCEVARRITRGVSDGPTLQHGMPWEPGLLLTHVVETLAADGWLTVRGHFGGSCGWQVAQVSPELHAWAAAERVATPSRWTMHVEELASESAA